jgi:hypothetical protein
MSTQMMLPPYLDAPAPARIGRAQGPSRRIGDPAPTGASARTSSATPPPAGRDTLRDPARLAALRRAAQIDGPGQRVLDSLTALATRALRAPVAAVTLVDTERQILVSVTGLQSWWARIGETPIEYSFCRHVVATGSPLVIPDTRASPLAAGNPFVSELGVRAYAGSPVWTREGHCLGAFAVLALEARVWSPAELEILDELAIAAALEFARAIGQEGNPKAAAIRDLPAVEPSPPAGVPAPDIVRAVPAVDHPERTVVAGTNVMLRLWHELHERRVVRVGLVYLGVSWLIIDVASEVLPPLGVPEYTHALIILAVALGFPIVLATAWAFDLTPDGITLAEERRPEAKA